MRTSRIRQKLNQNQPALITTLHLMDAAVFEMTSLMGFDGIWIDLEHHAHSVETASQMMRAARVGKSDIIARPAKGEFMRMQRLLEAGATALLYPQCDDAEEAAEFVKWAKFPPLGRRGCDAGNADNPYQMLPIPEYIAAANRETLTIVLIENPQALEAVEEIARVPGLDLLFLGPGDLSIALGIPGQTRHERILDAERKIAAAAAEAGIHWGLPVGDAAQAQEAIDLGARFICHSADLVLVKQGLEAIQRSFTSVGFSFD